MDGDLTMLTHISKTIQTCFTSASNKIHQRMVDNELLEETYISLGVVVLTLAT